MAKIKDFYNPTISETQYTGFINAINSINNFGSNWFSGLGSSGITALDDYILLKLGERDVFKAIGEDIAVSTYYKMSHLLMAYNYQLDGLFELLIPNDGSESGYNPLDNVNEVRHETTETEFDKGSEEIKLNMAARKSTTKNPSRTDSTVTSENTTAFDTLDYEKATNKQTNQYNYGAFNVENDSIATEDKTTNGSRHDDTSVTYDVKRHGNIGVTTSFDLIQGDRKLHYYTFFKEVADVIIKEFLASMLWEV